MDLCMSYPEGTKVDVDIIVKQIRCLFCSNNIPDKSEESKTKAQILRNKFRKLCTIFKIQFPVKWKVWNFARETFPFCEHCQFQIMRLGQFYDELDIIQREIRSIIATLSKELVEAEGKFEPTKNGNNETRSSAVGEPNAKHEYFRRRVYKGFSPHVVVQDCKKRSRKRRKVVVGSLKTKPGAFVCSNISNKESTEVIDVVCDPSELVTFDDDLGEPDDDYTPVQDVLDGSDAEDSNWNDSSREEGLNADCEMLQDLSARDDRGEIEKDKKNTEYTKSSIIEPTSSTSTSWNEKIPKVSRTKDLKHVKDNKYVYMGILFTKEENDVFKCLSCDFYTDGSRLKDAFLRIKLHIKKTHRTIKPPKPAFTAGRVELIDPATHTYRYDRYEFKFSETDNNYSCGTCHKTCGVNRGKRQKWLNIQKHIDIIHKKVWAGRCEICAKEFNNLVAHKQWKHTVNTHTRVCDKCGKEFNSALKLGNHMYQFHKEKTLACVECGQNFRNNKSLKEHMRRHTQEKPYVCEVCGQCFSRSGTLKNHFIAKHGERQFACKICTRSFAANSQLNRHIREVHEGIKPPPYKRRPKEKKIPVNHNWTPAPKENSGFFQY